jgi:hypothetical protein
MDLKIEDLGPCVEEPACVTGMDLKLIPQLRMAILPDYFSNLQLETSCFWDAWMIGTIDLLFDFFGDLLTIG